MKKILGISLVAVLAVSPMMANAAVDKTKSAAATGDATTLTTAAYVKGAYNVLADAINGEITARENADTTINNKIGDTSIGTNTTITGAIAALQSARTEDNADARLDALEETVNDTTTGLVKKVADNTSAISTLNGGDTTDGSVAKSIKDKVATLDANLSQTASTDGLALSITEVDGVITGISGSIAAGTYDTAGAANTAETNAKAYADGLIDTTLSSSSTDAKAASAKAVYDADVALGNRIDGITSNYATKTEVTANINGATASATLGNDNALTVTGSVTGRVPAMTSWADQSSDYVALDSGTISGGKATGTVTSTVAAPTYVEDQPSA